MPGGYYNLKREIGVPIPEVIDPDDWCLFTICVPNHPDWFLAVRNAVRFLTLGRYWLRDDRENSIKQAQSMGEEILRTLDMCTIDFTALAASLDNIAASLANIQTNVTVTQNCGAGGGSLVCIGEDGTPIINPPPIEPDPIPPGGDWPVDPGTDPPPGEDEDWTLFDARACAVSNSIYQMLVYITIALEGIIDSLVTLAAGIIALLALFPAAAAAAIGGASIIEIVGALVDLLSIETIADVLQEARQWVEDNQAEIVCLIYNYRYDLPGLRNEFASRLILAVTAVVSLTPEEQYRVKEFGKKWLPMSLLFRWFYEGGAYIDALAPYDCSNCASSLLFSDDFSVDHEVDSSWWVGDRASVLDGAMNFNARDISTARLTQNLVQYENYGATPGLYTDVEMTFKTRVVERDAGTNTFTLAVQDDIGGTPTRFSLDVGAQVLGQWVEQSISFPVMNLSSDGGLFVLRFSCVTNTSRLIVEIDDVVIMATAPG